MNSRTASGARNFISGIPCRTDAGGIIPPNWMCTALDANTPDGTWWTTIEPNTRNAGDAFSGIEASIASVEAAVKEQECVGIIGHEQGATLAAIVSARSALGEGPPLKFAVLCDASMPQAGPYADLLIRLRDSPAASIPTLHCVSESDGVSPGAAEELAACFTGAEILYHDGGGAMPGPSWWELTKAFPERVTGGNRWVTQHSGPFWYDSKPTNRPASW